MKNAQFKTDKFSSKSKELFNALIWASQAVNFSSFDQEYFEHLELLDIQAANKLINEMRNTQLQNFLNGEDLF
jgi:hypothetical protein